MYKSPLLSFPEICSGMNTAKRSTPALLSSLLEASALAPISLSNLLQISSPISPSRDSSPHHLSGDSFPGRASSRSWIDGRTRSQFGPIAWNAICRDIRWISPVFSTCDVSAEFRIGHNTDALIVCCSAPLSTRPYTAVIRGIYLLGGSTVHTFDGSNEGREKCDKEC